MRSTFETASFVIDAPRGGAVPVVCDSPHSGNDYPPDFHPVAPREAIRTTWDAYVDELWADAPAAGATLLAGKFPRSYIDANRAANDIDPEVLATPWPGPTELSEYTRRGMGLIRRFACSRVPMYDRKLTVAEVRRRIERYYRPYRVALRDALEAAWRRHAVVWHFNLHSMKSRGAAGNKAMSAPRADIVIGDRDGTTAPPVLTAWVAGYFSRLGHSVKINDPYRGADIVRAHGDPVRRRFSVQIEINRALYMDEASGTRNAGFGSLRAKLGGFVVAVRELLADGQMPAG